MIHPKEKIFCHLGKGGEGLTSGEQVGVFSISSRRGVDHFWNDLFRAGGI